MRTDQLLSIDTSAELATLCEARLQGSWQAPTELVRMALARGASRVEVGFLHSGFRIRAPGAALRVTDLGHLATALDASSSAHDRHRAIVALEASAADALLFTTAVDNPRVQIRTTAEHGTVQLSLPGDRAPRPGRLDQPAAATSLEVQVSGTGLDSDRAQAWLRESCRFATSRVLINGKRPKGGFTQGLYRVRLEAPLTCQLAVTREGDAPRLYLLQHGLVATRATIPGFPAFHGAVEMSEVVEAGATPARLREAVTPYLPELIDQAVLMLIRIAPRLHELDEATRCRITTLLLRAARQGLRRAEIFRLPLIEVIERETDQRSWWRLGELVEHSRSRGGIIFALTPDENPHRFNITRPPTVVLAADERAEMMHIVDLRFEQPPPVHTLHSLAARLRRSAGSLRESISRAAGDFFSRTRGRELSEEDLEQTEQKFLKALSSCGATWQNGHTVHWAMRGGRGPMRARHGEPTTILLARDDPAVQRSALVVAGDPVWLYPALAALSPHRGLNLEEPRRSWLEAVHGSSPHISPGIDCGRRIAASRRACLKSCSST